MTIPARPVFQRGSGTDNTVCSLGDGTGRLRPRQIDPRPAGESSANLGRPETPSTRGNGCPTPPFRSTAVAAKINANGFPRLCLLHPDERVQPALPDVRAVESGGL